MKFGTHLASLLAAILFFTSMATSHAAEPYGIGHRSLTLVDEARAIKASSGFAGSPTRRVDVDVWYPAGASSSGPTQDAALSRGRWPLVIYSHGTWGRSDDMTHLAFELVRKGYVVAAPNFALTSRTAFTHVRFADISDASEQVRDVRFVIDSLLTNPLLGPAIDANAIGVTGHSLGGVTSYFVTYGRQIRDPRIKAAAMIGAADPVQTAIEHDMGFWGVQHTAVSVPALFLSAEKDIFARTTGRPHAAYSRVETPKYEVLIRGGAHVWFHDGTETPEGNRNPDCLFFDKWMPQVQMPGCEERVPLIGALKQQALTRTVVSTFFDAYLKHDAGALARLRTIDSTDSAMDFRRED